MCVENMASSLDSRALIANAGDLRWGNMKHRGNEWILKICARSWVKLRSAYGGEGRRATVSGEKMGTKEPVALVVHAGKVEIRTMFLFCAGLEG